MRPQRFAFFGSEAKHEIFREAVAVALDLFVQAFYWHAVKLGQIAVEDDFLLAEHKNSCFYRDDQGRLGIVHVGILAGSARFGGRNLRPQRDAEGQAKKLETQRSRRIAAEDAEKKLLTAKGANNGRKDRKEKLFTALRLCSGQAPGAKNSRDGRHALEIGKRFGLVNFRTTLSARSV